MEAEGVDLVALLEGGPLPQLPDDLDDLFTDDLVQFLTAPDGSEAPAQGHRQEPVALPSVMVAAPAAISAPSASSSASLSEAGTSPSSPALPPAPAPASACGAASTPLAPLQAQAAFAVPRLVTTVAAQQMWTAMLQAAYNNAAPATATACVDDAKARSMQPAGTSRQGSHDCSADSSDTDHDDHEMVDSKGKTAGNKRKAPEVDWRQIEDPAERRRQRRLAKNRVTAARSRERKKAMWSELEEKLKNVENENSQLRAMLEQFARENASLKSQLLTITRAGAAAGGVAGMPQARAGKTTDPAVILPVFIVTLLVVCSILPGDKACALLGSVLPIALLASMLGNGSGADGGANGSHSDGCFDSLFRLLHMLGTLLSGGSRVLKRSFKRLLFDRHRYVGHKWLQQFAAASFALLRDPGIGIKVDTSSSGVAAQQPLRPANGGQGEPEAAGTADKPGGGLSLLRAVVKLEPACSG
ncbi:hypothetical protein PLESTB_001330800 [Pleodorina starrii]|uniref:BZIP domain-containing protein n=1 Tax=Pleodorina starrii TaxID=330485 RepID=A0A9W6BU45_9CHLO|nr:hypothetical protein PLESTM_001626800 [Pleodorina starrii]GLC58208.1 hypothetical protein PLESTB_001330800 [Pleodorina starrii]GLC75524.1 hypothetical protein PLESTF_001653000 [Pleodorina starrii]